MIWILLGVSIVYIAGSLMGFFFSTIYIAELRLSFLPYRMWGGRILLLFLIMQMRKRGVQRRGIFYSLCSICCLVIICVCVYTYRYVDFYAYADLSVTESRGLSFLYANIWYKNNHIDELVQVIAERDPDIVFFVEYTPEHHRVLYPQISEKYPYINTEYPRQGPAGKVILSKMPFTNLAPSLGREGGWKYGYISLISASTEFIFYLVHTTSPVSPHFFSMRNEQLDLLVRDLHIHDHIANDASVVSVVGDFNVSPWSPAYHRLASKRDNFDNVTRYIPGLMTWELPGGWIRSHIDHVWINKPDQLLQLEYVPLVGSDHDALYGVIRI